MNAVNFVYIITITDDYWKLTHEKGYLEKWLEVNNNPSLKYDSASIILKRKNEQTR